MLDLSFFVRCCSFIAAMAMTAMATVAEMAMTLSYANAATSTIAVDAPRAIPVRAECAVSTSNSYFILDLLLDRVRSLTCRIPSFCASMLNLVRVLFFGSDKPIKWLQNGQ